MLPTVYQVRGRLKASGWDFHRSNQDPKSLYDLIMNAIHQKPNDHTVGAIINQFIRLISNQQPFFTAYLVQMSHLKTCWPSSGAE